MWHFFPYRSIFPLSFLLYLALYLTFLFHFSLSPPLATRYEKNRRILLQLEQGLLRASPIASSLRCAVFLQRKYAPRWTTAAATRSANNRTPEYLVELYPCYIHKAPFRCTFAATPPMHGFWISRQKVQRRRRWQPLGACRQYN